MSLTKEKADQLCSILQALADGKTIEWKFAKDDTWHEWAMRDDSMLTIGSDSTIEYRIKREPREFWLAQISGDWRVVEGSAWAGRIKVREVIEE